jgi:cell division septation protein DedD
MKTNTFDRFIAGEDALSALLKTIPPFKAPDSLASRVLQAARAAEAEYHAAQENARGTFTFKSPDSLRDAVMREAQAQERAQAPRRQAIVAALNRHEDIEDVLGAAVSPKTETWLRETWKRQEEGPQPSGPKPTRKSAGWKRWAFAAIFGVTAVAVAGLTDHRFWFGLVEFALHFSQNTPAEVDEEERATTITLDLTTDIPAPSPAPATAPAPQPNAASDRAPGAVSQPAPQPASRASQASESDVTTDDFMDLLAEVQSPLVFVQVGSFSDAAEANTLANRLIRQGFAAYVEKADPLTLVRIGPLPQSEGKQIVSKLKAQGQGAELKLQ